MRWVVKIGSSVLSSPQGELQEEVLKGLARDLIFLWDQGVEVSLVTSGAVACGFRRLGYSEPPLSLPSRQAAAAVGQLYLLSRYEEVFREAHYPLGQILLTHEDFQERRRYLHARNTLETLLQHRCIPVINENDAVATEEILFGDNDQLSVLVAALLGAQLLVLLSDIPGIYDRPPEDPERKLLRELPSPRELLRTLPPGKNRLGRGGIHSKLLAASRAQELGIPVVVAPGRDPQVLRRILAGESVGTRIPAKERRLNARKFWLRYGTKPRGFLVVDAGAARALMKQNRSLLPSGVVEVQGNFQIGDPVEVRNQEAIPLAYGIVEYSAEELRRIAGKKSSEVAGILGYKRTDEVIHRNDLVLLEEHGVPG